AGLVDLKSKAAASRLGQPQARREQQLSRPTDAVCAAEGGEPLAVIARWAEREDRDHEGLARDGEVEEHRDRAALNRPDGAVRLREGGGRTEREDEDDERERRDRADGAMKTHLHLASADFPDGNAGSRGEDPAPTASARMPTRLFSSRCKHDRGAQLG